MLGIISMSGVYGENDCSGASVVAEFAKVNTLPSAKVEASVGYWNSQ